MPTCAEFKRRWDISIAAADADLSSPSSGQVLHNHAFSRQCWQYSHDESEHEPIADADHVCDNSMQQFGFTADWWDYNWKNSNGASYTGEPASNPLTMEDHASFGRYILCASNSNNDGGCSLSTSVYLSPTHPSFRWPRSEADAGVNSTAPTDASVTMCDASGAYAPVLDFPISGPSGSEESSRRGELTRITPDNPPPPPLPSLPPLPPNPPPAPAYTLTMLQYEPTPAGPACEQTVQAPIAPLDVLSATECAAALTNLGLSGSAEPAMAGAYSEGFRCFANTANMFVWSVVAGGSPSGMYVCRHEY